MIHKCLMLMNDSAKRYVHVHKEKKTQNFACHIKKKKKKCQRIKIQDLEIQELEILNLEKFKISSAKY